MRVNQNILSQSRADEESYASLTQRAYHRLRADLLALRIKPGARLKIVDLANRLEVSAGAVREALSRIASEGLVVAEPMKGFRATPISADELRDLTRARVLIEAECIRLGLRHADAGWESALAASRATLRGLPRRSAGDDRRTDEQWAHAHRDYHAALVMSCGSPTLLALRRQLYEQSERYRRLSLPLEDHARDVEREHDAIAAAAIERDEAKTIALVTLHIVHTTEIILRSLQDGVLHP